MSINISDHLLQQLTFIKWCDNEWLCLLGEKASKSKDQPSQKREDQLAHLNIDFAPASPAASSETPSLMRENSVTSISTLPPDAQKFLKFAGIL